MLFRFFMYLIRCFFFFQAEDGIRDDLVTGVQTCALPISHIPVVAWRVKGTREVVRSGESGLLAPPGDLGQTTAHIVGLLEDPALRRRLGAAAAERVRTHFNESVVVAHLAQVYASLLRDAGYGPPTDWETHDERAVLSA